MPSQRNILTVIATSSAFVLFASVVGAAFLIVRAIIRFFFVRKDVTQTVTATDMHLNRRADRPFG